MVSDQNRRIQDYMDLSMFRHCDGSLLKTSRLVDDYCVGIEDYNHASKSASADRIMEDACENGSWYMIRRSMDNGATLWCTGLRGAYKGGHKDIIHFMIRGKIVSKQTSDITTRVSWKHNHTHLFDMSDWKGVHWNAAILGAAEGGHLHLVQLLENYGDVHWDEVLSSSCRSGNKELIQYVIKKGANWWNGGLEGACAGHHKDIAKQMIQRGADLLYGFYGACEGGHVDMVKFIMDRGFRHTVYILNHGLQETCRGDNPDMIKYLIGLGANRKPQYQGGIKEIDDLIYFYFHGDGLRHKSNTIENVN